MRHAPLAAQLCEGRAARRAPRWGEGGGEGRAGSSSPASKLCELTSLRAAALCTLGWREAGRACAVALGSVCAERIMAGCSPNQAGRAMPGAGKGPPPTSQEQFQWHQLLQLLPGEQQLRQGAAGEQHPHVSCRRPHLLRQCWQQPALLILLLPRDALMLLMQ